MPLALATFRDQAILERNVLLIGAMAVYSLVMNWFDVDTIIRMVVAFVVGEPYPIWLHQFPRQLVPLSRRFVPEPVEMTYIVMFSLPFSVPFGHRLGWASGIPSAIKHLVRLSPFLNECMDIAPVDMDFQRICSICGRGAAEIHPVRHVTLQTRLRRPFWKDTEAFRAFINDRIVHVEINVCRNCVRRCNMP